jgi:predicted nucleotidyltransferase
MQKLSFGSVQVTWLDRPAVLEATRKAVRALARRRPEVQRVILFGSMARGDAVPGSDVDLLMVLSECNQPFLDRIPRYKPSGIPIGVDVFPYTEEELQRMLAEGNFFIKQALSEGITVFQRKTKDSSG